MMLTKIVISFLQGLIIMFILVGKYGLEGIKLWIIFIFILMVLVVIEHFFIFPIIFKGDYR